MSRLFNTEFWPVIRDTLFPKRCLACGRGVESRRAVSFCQQCRGDVRSIREPWCTVCGKPFAEGGGNSHLCSYCLNHAWHFERARSAVYYQGPIAGALKLFKYGGRMYPLETFAYISEQYCREHRMLESDLIIPVPLHPERLRKRGFNQALMLCRKLFGDRKKIIAPFVLQRHRRTKPQAGLSASERRGNVKNAFRVKKNGRLQNKRILLVDDVFTTGATVNECARVLRKNGAASVEVFTLARVVDR